MGKTTTTTTTTVNATVTTTTADESYPWATPCGRRRLERFRNSRICRRMRRLIALVRELDDVAGDLIERMPESGPLNEYSDDLGRQFADDLKAGVWSIRIVADLMESEMPLRAGRRPAAKKVAPETTPLPSKPSKPRQEKAPALVNRVAGIA